MHFHEGFLGNQHEIWLKQHNGKVSIKRLVKKTVLSGSASQRLPRKVLSHNNMSGVKPPSSSDKIEQPMAWVHYGLVMSQVFA